MAIYFSRFYHRIPDSRGFNAILIVVERYTKMAYFVPCTKEITSEETVGIVMREVFRHHGLPESIISDRGPQFVSKFWKHLFKMLNVENRARPQPSITSYGRFMNKMAKGWKIQLKETTRPTIQEMTRKLDICFTRGWIVDEIKLSRKKLTTKINKIFCTGVLNQWISKKKCLKSMISSLPVITTVPNLWTKLKVVR